MTALCVILFFYNIFNEDDILKALNIFRYYFAYKNKLP